MKYSDLIKKPERFLALTGYTPERFDALLPYFEEAHDEYLSKYKLNGKPRDNYRKFVIYTNSPLPTVKDRLLFVLSYLKTNPLQEMQAELFSMEQKQCNEFIHGLKTILDKSLVLAQVTPATNQKQLDEKLNELEEQAKEEPLNKHLLHDGTEREIPRPENSDEQKDKYSGKKKKHTIKNAVIATLSCYIIFVSPSVPGRIHDKKIAEAHYKIRSGFILWQDTGYQGYKPEGVCIKQPMKKPKGGELSKEQKENNKQISEIRVRIEHTIGSAKRYRIVKDECRLRKNNFVDHCFLTTAALHNFRLKKQPFFYENKLT